MPRNWKNKPEDNTGRLLEFEEQSPAYAAAIEIQPKANETFIDVGQLTGPLALTADVSLAQKWDKVRLSFNADGTARTVTPGTGINATDVVVAINSKATLSLMFDGTEFVETGRYVQ